MLSKLLSVCVFVFCLFLGQGALLNEGKLKSWLLPRMNLLYFQYFHGNHTNGRMIAKGEAQLFRALREGMHPDPRRI